MTRIDNAKRTRDNDKRWCPSPPVRVLLYMEEDVLYMVTVFVILYTSTFVEGSWQWDGESCNSRVA